MTAAWSWSVAEAGQERQVGIIARQAVSGWLESSGLESWSQLPSLAVIGLFVPWVIAVPPGSAIQQSSCKGNQGSVDPCGSKQFSWLRTGGSTPLQTSSAVPKMQSEHGGCVFAPGPMRCHLPNASAASEDMDRPRRVRTSGHPRLRRADVAARGQTSRLAPCCGHPAGVHKA